MIICPMLSTMFLFINYIPTPIGVYVPLLTATRAIYSYVTMNKFDQSASIILSTTMNHMYEGAGGSHL